MQVSMCDEGPKSISGRPLHLDSVSFQSEDGWPITDDVLPLEPISSQRFSFDKPPVLSAALAEKPSFVKSENSDSSPKLELRPTDSADIEPEHELLKGFLRKPSADRIPERRPCHARHLSLEDDRRLSNPPVWSPEPFPYTVVPSPFLQTQEDLSCAEYTDTETVERVDSLGTIIESESDTKDNLKEEKPTVTENCDTECTTTDADEKENCEEEKSTVVETTDEGFKKSEKAVIKIDTKTTQDDYFESPCSSPRSNFSDSAATKFVNSNFCNPAFYEDPIDVLPSPCVGGSIRQRYTMKRLQSLLSQRSLVTDQSPRVEEKSFAGRPPRTPTHQDSMRSFRGRSFKGLGVSSFRSRSGEEDESQVLSDAYRLVKLESCIRKAWKISMGDSKQEGGGGETFRDRESSGQLSPSMQSFKKIGSRRFDRAHRISFVKVPADFSQEMLMSRKEMLLNPAFGDDDLPTNDGASSMVSDTEGDTVMDTSSVIMRTPLRRLGSTTHEDYEKCEKNLEEGTFDNPLRLCSFRSYDSDTELELTSVRVRNPISRLLSFRLNRGANKDCIPLADIDSDEYGAMMFDRVNSNPIKGGMMEKYLTQLVIDDTLDAHLMGDVPVYADEDSLGWSTCQQEWVPHEMDNRLKCFLLDRFLIDNVLNEVDLDPIALKNAAAKGKKGEPSPAARKLRRS